MLHLRLRREIRAGDARVAEVAVDRISKDDGGGQSDDPEHHEPVEEVVLQLLPPWSAKDLFRYSLICIHMTFQHEEDWKSTSIYPEMVPGTFPVQILLGHSVLCFRNQFCFLRYVSQLTHT